MADRVRRATAQGPQARRYPATGARAPGPAAPLGRKPESIGQYIIGKSIGEGTFGKVKLGTHVLTGEKVAVKVLEKERIVEVEDVGRVAREIHILKLLRHPHVIQLYEIVETTRQLYLLMEYASGGELFDYIVANARVKELEACKFFHQILTAVEKIHSMQVAHRDLKPENLLLDEHRNIKIVDFGLSNTFQDGALLKTACGSPCYAAPEMIAGKKYVPSLCDIWSCGVILFALICGYLPFEDQNTACLYKKILKGEYQAPNFLSDAARDLIRKMLTTDPTKRYQIVDIRQHAWFTQVSGACIEGAWMDESAPHLDEQILSQLERLGFPQEYAVKCLQMNKHNHVTTTYCLLLEKKRRMVERLVATGAPVDALPTAPLSARAERPEEPYREDERTPYTPGGQSVREAPRPAVPAQTPGHVQTPHTARAGYPHSARGAPSPRTRPAEMPPQSARTYRDDPPRSRVSSAGSQSSRDYPSYKVGGGVATWASPRRRSPVTLGYVTPRGPTATAVVDRLYGGSRSGTAATGKPPATTPRPHSVGSTDRQYAPPSARLQSRSSTPTTRRTTSPHGQTPSR